MARIPYIVEISSGELAESSTGPRQLASVMTHIKDMSSRNAQLILNYLQIISGN